MLFLYIFYTTGFGACSPRQLKVVVSPVCTQPLLSSSLGFLQEEVIDEVVVTRRIKANEMRQACSRQML
jgi:hypothetical protein